MKYGDETFCFNFLVDSSSTFDSLGFGAGMPLSLKQLTDVCMAYSSDYRKCRYLAQDDSDLSKWYCLKKSSKRVFIDDETSDFLKELKKKGLDAKRQGIPLGDNCNGYPILKHIEQGYDK